MISLLTASIPHRWSMLCEALESVNNQTVTPDYHMVAVGHKKQDAPDLFNRLAKGVTTEWVTFLDDDDVLDPEHIETLQSAMSDDVDVVYTGCRCSGNRIFQNYNVPYSDALLKSQSCVPITAAIRTELFNKIGGFPTDVHYYDWQLWVNALDNGARIRQINKITWTYRYHGRNRSVEGVYA